MYEIFYFSELIIAYVFLYVSFNDFRTIFDVDIDNFEEKPWKYPGVDTSDFFNFGFNEDSWKDYCKQLVIVNFLP